MKIKRPTLLVDESKVRKNIRVMKAKADKSDVIFRPHFKTHHSADIGEWFRQEGIHQITCSSVSMASYFARHGWKDITIAFPYNPLEFEEINKLAGSITLNIVLESKESLINVISQVKAPLNIFLKIDLGTHRTGLDPENESLISALLNFDFAHHRLTGLLGHAGHSYQKINQQKALSIFEESKLILNKLKRLCNRKLILSYGDTPTCSLLHEFQAVDELRPGNFAFYDIMQHSFGACEIENIAVCLACPVLAVHPSRNEAVIYGGGVHLSKDHIMFENQQSFGTVVDLKEFGWATKPKARLSRLSQEHGIISGSQSYISSLKVGDIVGILPIHSCLTADLQGYYVTLEGTLLGKQNRNSNLL